jgi:hypothetical protein
MSEPRITTLSEFLHQTGAKYRVFDMGRRVTKLLPDEFVNFERATKPYPYPFQRSALFGVIFWNPKQPDKHYVWFLKFPLDEQGLLIQSARDEFLVMLLERVGECMLAADQGELIEGALKDSPYSFSPREDRMAAFNAQATKALTLPPSQYYQRAHDYFTGQLALEKWQSLGMQGIADVAMRLHDSELTLGIIHRIPLLPEPPFLVLCTFLEHSDPPAGIVEVLAQRVDIELQEKQPHIERICACLRAMSNSPAHGLVDRTVTHVLNHPCSNHIEVLAIISGRIWRILQQEKLCKLYLERLAHNDTGYHGFSQLLADSLYMPGLREPIMQALRNPQRSHHLSRFVGKLFGSEDDADNTPPVKH